MNADLRMLVATAGSTAFLAALLSACGGESTSVPPGVDAVGTKHDVIISLGDPGKVPDKPGDDTPAGDALPDGQGNDLVSPPGCTDLDGDGHGPGCEAGPDCDDSDASHFDDCPDCAKTGAPGCPCMAPDQKIDCFSGNWGMIGIGPCKAGKQTCTGGHWTECEGQVLPGEEVCDLADNDCDGKVDEDFPQGCNPGGCDDLDGDGYGDGCENGPDCDDNNPNFHVDCPGCGAEPKGGCPCPGPGNSKPCYSGDMALLGIGACKAGTMVCSASFWTNCQGEVLPQLEFCDGKDNDCDGKTDEGVLNECGNCDPMCYLKKAGPGGDEPFAPGPGKSSEGVVLTPEGWLTLSESAYSLHFIWISNSAEDTVSKLDTITGKELGRYAICNDPSRTTVDKNGDGWIACRGDGRVVKIRNVVEKCTDMNGDGEVKTSKDANGDGTIQAGEMVANDDCVLFKVQPEGGNGLARALGSDLEGYAWAGFWNPSTLHRLDPNTGKSVAAVKLPAQPYGIAIDSKGVVWISGRGGSKLLRVDPDTLAVKSYEPNIGCFDPYGITVDEFDRPWIANCCCDNVAYVFNPKTGGWGKAAVHARPRGIASNRKGFVYVANDQSDEVARINNTTFQVSYGSIKAGRFPIGMAVDSNGFVWAVNQSAGSATKLDPTTLKIELEKKVGTGPYTYSDMTGSLFFDSIVPQGFYRIVYEGPDLDPYTQEWYEVVWESLDIDYAAPAGTHIEARARTAKTKAGLDAAKWSEVYGPSPPKGYPVEFESFMDEEAKGRKWLELEVTLYSSENTKPIVKAIKVQYGAKWKEQ